MLCLLFFLPSNRQKPATSELESAAEFAIMRTECDQSVARFHSVSYSERNSVLDFELIKMVKPSDP